ncbi:MULTISPECIES: TonB family protein [unclassified Phenylobacterium]|uniref:TonB family protein n=1 Tax=unclassified Phenylobacterium TaxID=2640670 RepID=UPI0009E9F80D|nr:MULTISPECIES: TonB family protein [unclassified Phenylobacterium]
MLSALLVIMVQATPAPPATVPATPNPIVSPHWIQRPSGADINRFYPVEAARRETEGRAVIVCGVNGEGTLVDCKVVEEAPVNFGFGEAALKLSTRFRMTPTTADGQSVAGGTVRIPLRFAVPGRLDPLSAMYACYGLTAVEAERRPEDSAAQAAYGFFVAQAALIASKNKSTPTSFEAGLADARRAASDPARPPLPGPTLAACLKAAAAPQ